MVVAPMEFTTTTATSTTNTMTRRDAMLIDWDILESQQRKSRQP